MPSSSTREAFPFVSMTSLNVRSSYPFAEIATTSPLFSAGISELAPKSFAAKISLLLSVSFLYAPPDDTL